MLTLSLAQSVIFHALADARARGASPLAVVVLDAGGHVIASAREDGATFFRLDIARAKATGALGMGMDTRVLAARAKDNQAFFTSLAVAVEGQMAFSPGGVIIWDAANKAMGAVGISGDVGDMDELCAHAGLRAAGLRAAGLA